MHDFSDLLRPEAVYEGIAVAHKKALFAQLAEALPSHELSAQQRERMRQRVRRSVVGGPSEGPTTVHAHQGEWIALTPLVELKVLRIDARAGNQTVMVRAKPGGKMQRHRHGQDEEFIVLEGECRIGDLHLRAGDALGNIHLIQSFVRLGAEAGAIQGIIRRTLEAQYPVLNWWALLSVLTRAASTISRPSRTLWAAGFST